MKQVWAEITPVHWQLRRGLTTFNVATLISVYNAPSTICRARISTDFSISIPKSVYIEVNQCSVATPSGSEGRDLGWVGVLISV